MSEPSRELNVSRQRIPREINAPAPAVVISLLSTVAEVEEGRDVALLHS
jgi:hypothetical protein